jgi:superfamily II DNA or RNA helicase
MALFIACVLRVKTIVLVHKAFLADQWVERAHTFVPTAKVTLYGNGTHDFSGDIVVATIQTVLSRGLPSEHQETPGFVIIDEAHRVAAPSFSKVIVGLNAPYILGLSATPERTDRLSRVIHWVCGPLIKATDDEEQKKKHQVTVLRKTFPGGHREIPQNRRGDVDHASLITQLAEDDQRTAFIVKCMVENIDAETDCLVLSHRRAQCLLLAECLRHQGYDAATYLGGDKSVPSNKILVCTYSLVSEGFDVPRLSTLVFATPASNITQAVGRILRTPGSKLIIDILDTNPVSYAQATKRRIFYASSGYLGTPQKKPNVYLFRD